MAQSLSVALSWVHAGNGEHTNIQLVTVQRFISANSTPTVSHIFFWLARYPKGRFSIIYAAIGRASIPRILRR